MALNDFSKQDHVAISSLGMEFALAEVLGCGVGYWLDKRWGTLPWMLIAGVFCGFGLGIYIVWRRAKELARQTKTQEKQK
ncbi:AtpZ/AtpI family protein [Candidatus Avelusimicrobium luingense]|uniref:AtpZ/AtpI family protein n=1 Tax=Candidatus Avelusimicrobium luingense TaxID=3416211 RepID=UPI003D129D12